MRFCRPVCFVAWSCAAVRVSAKCELTAQRLRDALSSPSPLPLPGPSCPQNTYETVDWSKFRSPLEDEEDEEDDE